MLPLTIANPIYGLLLSTFLMLELGVTMIIREDNSPKPDPFYGFIRLLLIILLASYIVNTIVYNPILNRQILSLIFMIISLYIGILGVFMLKIDYINSSLLISIVLTFIVSIIVGILGSAIGIVIFIILVLVFRYSKKKVEIIDVNKLEKQWNFISSFYLPIILGLISGFIFILQVQGFLFF